MVDSAIDVGMKASLGFRGCSIRNVTSSGPDISSEHIGPKRFISPGGRGGGIYSSDSSLSVGAGAADAFVNNSAPVGDGGGLCGARTYIELAGDGAALLFADNFSGTKGGGLALTGMETDQKGCPTLAEGYIAIFSRNVCSLDGGGVFLENCDAYISGNASFRENEAKPGGGLDVVVSKVSVDGAAGPTGGAGR